MKVPLTCPFIGDEEKVAVAEVLDSGWLTQGAAVTEFERAVAKRVGARHAIAFTSCTTALHIALLGLGVQPGDDVVVPSYTWIATANAVCMLGARPVFADIDLETYNVTVRTVEAAMTKRTRAIVVVDQFGLPADIRELGALASARQVALLEDAACAIGSRYLGRDVGGWGYPACFSFHPRKLVTTGEGGMLTTDDDAMAERARRLVNHGASVMDTMKHRAGSVDALLAEEFAEVGYNYRLTNLQGAIGAVQIAKLDENLAGRRRLADRYLARLSRVAGLVLPHVPEGVEPNWQSFCVRVADRAAARNRVAQHLLDAGVACRPAYMACHVQPLYRRMHPGLALPATEQALASVLILPLFAQMTDAEHDYVVDTLTAALRAV